MAAASTDRVCVAAIAGGFGVRGEVRVKSFTVEPTAFAGYGPLETEDGRQRFAVTLLRAVSGGFAVRLDGITTRDAADALKGCRLYAPRDRLPPLSEDEFYHADLIGLPVHDTGGAPIGRVLAVQDHGGGHFLEIARDGQAPLLLPFTRLAVPTVDLVARRIVADPPGEIVVQPHAREDGDSEDGTSGDGAGEEGA